MQNTRDCGVDRGAKLPRPQAISKQSQRTASEESDVKQKSKQRASMPKVRSGCVTCKARRVKCDERKPSCLRCENFGQLCEGYARTTSSRPPVPIAPLINTAIPPNVSLSPHKCDEEDLYFRRFIDTTASELSGYHDNPFWHRLVQHESHGQQAIRYACIALGALSMSMVTAPHLRVNIIQTMDRRHRTNAYQAYDFAIRHLNHYVTSSRAPQLRVTLITCLLFICFETILGQFAASVSHTYGGLKMMRSYYCGRPGSRPWIPDRKARVNTPQARLKAEQISHDVLSRLGCDGVSRELAMTMHVDEYLAGEHEDMSLFRERKPFMEQAHRSELMEDSTMGNGVPPPDGLTAIGSRVAATQTQVQSNSISSTGESTSRALAKRRLYVSTASSATLRSSTRISSTAVSQSSSPMSPSSPKLEPTLTLSEQSVGTKRKRLLASQPSSASPQRLQNDEVIDACIFQTFARLDGQGLFFGMIPRIPPLVWDIHGSWHLPIPTIFTSFEAAQQCWDFLQDRCLQFYRRTLFNRHYQPSNAQSEEEITAMLNMCNAKLVDFEKAFGPILSAADAFTNPAALVLGLYYALTTIFMGRIGTDNEMVYDRYLSQFRYIIATSSSIIAAHTEGRLGECPRFSFDIGIVPPLHVTATRCRDPVMRREAIALLFSSPRQEGMWDSIVSARVGCWVVRQEEEGLPPPELPYGIVRELSVSNGSFSTPISPASLPTMESIPNPSQDMESGSTRILGGLYPRTSGQQSDESSLNLNIGWTVPESHRVELKVVDFHILERNMHIRCEKVLSGPGGKKAEMATVIAW